MKIKTQIILCLAIFVLTIVAEEKPMNTISVSSDPPVQSNTIHEVIHYWKKYPEQDDYKSLKKVFLSNRSITCNDGSQAGFYLRKSQGSSRWIIFLEGGWYCNDHDSCRNRWLKSRHLMTSTEWTDTRDVGGILSPIADENPFWWNSNHVFVPYCTSDSWTGTRNTPEDVFTFMGADVVTQVVRDLVPLGLEGAESFILSGSSAGGMGVMLNLNRVHDLLHHELGLKHIAVGGVSDSGWFVDRTPYSRNNASPRSASPIDAIQKGMKLWKTKMPHDCAAKYPNQKWKCFFGYRLYPSLIAPLFIFQWLFDEAQLSADNVGPPVTKQQWNYIHEMGDNLRKTFENVTAVFAPSCINHSSLTKKDWKLFEIDNISLPQALYCWEQMITENHRNSTNHLQTETNQPCSKSPKKLLRSGATKGNGTSIESRRGNAESSMLTQKASSFVLGKMQERRTGSSSTHELESKKKRRRKHKGKRRERNKKGRTKKEKHERRKAAGRRKGGKQNNGNNHSAVFNGTRPQRSVVPSGKRKCIRNCHFRLIERCSWPQCNHSCPKLHNPFTGGEMEFIDLLKSFGVDMGNVATALGIDIHTLNSMDQEELLNLLTQRAD